MRMNFNLKKSLMDGWDEDIANNAWSTLNLLIDEIIDDK